MAWRSLILAALAAAACQSKAGRAPSPEPPLASARAPAPVPAAAQVPAPGSAAVDAGPSGAGAAPREGRAGEGPAPAPAAGAGEDERPEDEIDEAELTGPLPKGVKRDKVAGGTHYRFRASRGVVHVWVPPGYRSKSGGIVVYVHGYGTLAGRMSADNAWASYRLAEQFKESRQNAVFIVPDAPTSNEDGVKFPRLSELLRAVWKNTHLRRPSGPLVVIGHSGAFRTIVEWLDYRPLAHVILLDGLFGYAGKFVEWLQSVKGHQNHKLTMVGQKTAAAAESFLRKFDQKTIVRLSKVPARFSDLPKRARTARILYIRSQFGHMALVTSKKVIPIMLRRTPLKPI